MMRRVVGIGATVLVLILLVFLVKSCRSAQKEQAFKDYNRDVGALIQESDDQSKSLFDALENGSDSAVALQDSVNGYAQEADQLVKRANGTDHPGELDDVHRYLVETLEFRRDGLKQIADQLPAALGNNGADASKAIAGQMLQFVTSDVIYSQRFVPRFQSELKSQDLDSEKPPRSQFLNDIGWLDEATTQDRIARIGSGEAGGGSGGPVAPGLHGNGLGTVTVQPGGTQLNEGGATQIKAASNTSFDVQVLNQGENDEKNVKVTLTIRGGDKPIELEETLPAIAAGETKTVNIPLSTTPTAGQPVTIRIVVGKVPGEEKTDNNRADFPAVFSR
jgi:hypothetical protein